MEQLLRLLLEDLEVVEAEHPEVGDTDVRELMRDAIHDGFISPKAGFTLGEQFAMFTLEGNKKVRDALQRFLDRAATIAAQEGLDTPTARLEAFQNSELQSSGGNYYDDYFGYCERP
jgi:hypothetical protein